MNTQREQTLRPQPPQTAADWQKTQMYWLPHHQTMDHLFSPSGTPGEHSWTHPQHSTMRKINKFSLIMNPSINLHSMVTDRWYSSGQRWVLTDAPPLHCCCPASGLFCPRLNLTWVSCPPQVRVLVGAAVNHPQHYILSSNWLWLTNDRRHKLSY